MRFLFSLFALLTALTVWAQQPDRKACVAARKQALKDAHSGNLRYYYFGIAGASKETIAKAEALGVKAVSGGCMISDSLQCYNAAADSLVYARKQVRLSGLR